MGFVVLQSGQSHTLNCREHAPNDIGCVIHGGHAPYVAFNLKPAQSILCDFDDVRLVGEDISVRPWPSLSKSTRLMVNAGQSRAARVVLSNGRAGHIGAFNLSEFGKRIVCRSNSFLAAGSAVMANCYTKHRTHTYGALEFLVLDGTGWIFLQSKGEVMQQQLAAGERLTVNAAAIVALSATIDLSNYPNQGRRQADREVDGRLAQLTGPGMIWLQSCITRGETTRERSSKQEKPQLALIS